MSSNHNNTFWINNPMILVKNNNFLRFIPTSKMSRVEQLNSLTLFLVYAIILMILLKKSVNYIYACVAGIVVIIVFYKIYSKDNTGKLNELRSRQGQIYGELMNSVNPPNEYHQIDSDAEDNVPEPADENIKVGQIDFSGNVHFPSEKDVPIKYGRKESEEYVKKSCRKPTKDNPFMNPTLADDENVPEACNVEDSEIKDLVDTKFNEGLYKDLNDLYDIKNSQRQFHTVQPYPPDYSKFGKWLYSIPKTCKENQFACNPYEPLSMKRSYDIQTSIV